MYNNQLSKIGVPGAQGHKCTCGTSTSWANVRVVRGKWKGTGRKTGEKPSFLTEFNKRRGECGGELTHQADKFILSKESRNQGRGVLRDADK